MKTFTIADIRDWKPCYDPGTVLPENWSGTALDILRKRKVSYQDRLWVVLRPAALDEKISRLFTVWCARSVQHLMTDGRSIAAIDVAEKFIHGEATEEELARAYREAWGAWEKMRKVGDAAWVAAAVAAQAVAARAAGAAADAALWSAGAVAAVAEGQCKQSRNAQVAHLIKMLEAV